MHGNVEREGVGGNGGEEKSPRTLESTNSEVSCVWELPSAFAARVRVENVGGGVQQLQGDLKKKRGNERRGTAAPNLG